MRRFERLRSKLTKRGPTEPSCTESEPSVGNLLALQDEAARLESMRDDFARRLLAGEDEEKEQEEEQEDDGEEEGEEYEEPSSPTAGSVEAEAEPDRRGEALRAQIARFAAAQQGAG